MAKGGFYDDDGRYYNESGEREYEEYVSNVVPMFKEAAPPQEESPGLCQLDLLRHVDDCHILKKMAIEVSKACCLPPSTVFMVGLGVVSSIAMRRYAVEYRDRQLLPIGLYVVAEQPSGTAKSRCLASFTRPFIKMARAANKNLEKQINVLKTRLKQIKEPSKKIDVELEIDELEKKKSMSLFVTDCTPEALEYEAVKSGGFFAAVSDEQGLFNTLFGKTYGKEGSRNNNDMVLKGFKADYSNSKRVSREGFSGFPIGAVVAFAQDGSFRSVFDASNGSGLCERFLAVLEPDSLGRRVYLTGEEDDQGNDTEFDLVMGRYASICNRFNMNMLEPCELDDLCRIKLNWHQWKRIDALKNSIEPMLGDGGKYSSPTMRSLASKMDMQVMKIAAVLQVFSGGFIGESIDNCYMDSAIAIVSDVIEGMVHSMDVLGIDGASAEEDAIMALFERSGNRPRSMPNIKNNMRSKKEFSHLHKGVLKQIEMVVMRMVAKRKLKVAILDGSEYFKT